MGDDGNNSSPMLKSTPPIKFKVRNPFERALLSTLHKPICSPGMFKKYKQKKCKGDFKWDIDQKCVLAPTDIIACSSQFDPSPDPVLERNAEEATERFFSQEVILPSPFDLPVKVKPLQISREECLPLDMSKTKHSTILKEASAQTVLSLPPILPEEIEKILGPFCTYTEDQQSCNELDMSAYSLSLRRKLFFEEHSESEQSEEEHEISMNQCPAITYKPHTPINIVSPELSRDMLMKGMRRTFGTPINSGSSQMSYKTTYRNKIFDSVELSEPGFSPISLGTPATPMGSGIRSGSSLSSDLISPVHKIVSSDDEKQNFTSPESEEMASCLNCVSKTSKQVSPCFCKSTPNKSLLRRCKSFKDSPVKYYRSSAGNEFGVYRRSLSMSSLHRSRSVQKLDFSMDMSVDGSVFGNEDALRCNSVLAGSDVSVSPHQQKEHWKMEMSKIEKILDNHSPVETHTPRNASPEDNHIKETPIKGKKISNVLTHHITRIRSDKSSDCNSPMQMSLDMSVESDTENPLSMEHKKIDFENIDLKLLTSNFHNTQSTMKLTAESTSSFKRLDSGYNENSFFASKSNYDNTVTDFTKSSNSSSALKEISNTGINWMRVDSGFKDETSSETCNFYTNADTERKSKFMFKEAALNDDNKENIFDDFDHFLARASTRSECMSISDMFADEMALNCNYSSTPSKSNYKPYTCKK